MTLTHHGGKGYPAMGKIDLILPVATRAPLLPSATQSLILGLHAVSLEYSPEQEDLKGLVIINQHPLLPNKICWGMFFKAELRVLKITEKKAMYSKQVGISGKGP